MPAKAGTDEEERARGQASEKLELRRVDDQLGVYAIAPIDAGERLIALARVFVDRADRFTIQIDELLHQAGTFEMDDYLNHSCHPNCFLDFEQLAFVALRPIAVGEQLSFNYLSSEWSMATPFRCWCDATGAERVHCVHEIRGFKFLRRDQQIRLRPLLSPFLRRKLHELLAGDPPEEAG